MDRPCINQLFGISDTESSWPECLGSAHCDFLVEFVRQAQEREEAVVNSFLEQAGEL
jgi:hypothetical protein